MKNFDSLSLYNDWTEEPTEKEKIREEFRKRYSFPQKDYSDNNNRRDERGGQRT